MDWYYLTQQDWNTLRTEISQNTDLAYPQYLSPEESKKSKRPLINEDRTMLLMWENQGATIGTWRLWTRTPATSSQYLNQQTGVTTIRPSFPLYDAATETYTSSSYTGNINRSNFQLTAAQKRKVDRHGRTKNWKDYVSLLSGVLVIVEDGVPLNFRLHTEALQPILNQDGTSPYRTGFAFEPDNLYVINWNAKAPRIIGNES